MLMVSTTCCYYQILHKYSLYEAGNVEQTFTNCHMLLDSHTESFKEEKIVDKI